MGWWLVQTVWHCRGHVPASCRKSRDTLNTSRLTFLRSIIRSLAQCGMIFIASIVAEEVRGRYSNRSLAGPGRERGEDLLTHLIHVS